jgi:hypothetical protein
LFLQGHILSTAGDAQEAHIWGVSEDVVNIVSLKILHVLIGPFEKQMKFSLVLAQQNISMNDPHSYLPEG